MTDYRDRVLTLLTWLYDVEQPDGAIIMHHGLGVRLDTDRRLRATPYGVDGSPVVIFEVQPILWSGTYRDPDRHALNGIRAGEIEGIADVITSTGRHVIDRWNGGVGNATASLLLGEPAHPSLIAAVNRYHAGCPRHDTVFCSQAPTRCSWFRTGDALAIRPEPVPADA